MYFMYIGIYFCMNDFLETLCPFVHKSVFPKNENIHLCNGGIFSKIDQLKKNQYVKIQNFFNCSKNVFFSYYFSGLESNAGSYTAMSYHVSLVSFTLNSFSAFPNFPDLNNL